MSRVVLDTSAVLALLFQETGAEKVIARGQDGIISAVSYSETVAKSLDRGVPLETVQHALAGMKLTLAPFDAEHALDCGNLPAAHPTPERLFRRPRLFGDGVAGPSAGADRRSRLGRVRPRRQTHPNPVGDMGTGRDIIPGAAHAGTTIRAAQASPRNAPAIVRLSGESAQFAWDEFFQGEIANPHTRKNYLHAVRKFLAWAEDHRLELVDISPGDVGEYFQDLPLAVPTKKLHLAALRKFFDRLVNRHVVVINPAATVRAERYSVVEGKTPEIHRDQARDAPQVDRRFNHPSGLRDQCRPRRAHIHGRPRRGRRRAYAQEPQARRHAVHASLLRKGRQSHGKSRCGMTWSSCCSTYIQAADITEARSSAPPGQDEEAHRQTR